VRTKTARTRALARASKKMSPRNGSTKQGGRISLKPSDAEQCPEHSSGEWTPPVVNHSQENRKPRPSSSAEEPQTKIMPERVNLTEHSPPSTVSESAWSLETRWRVRNYQDAMKGSATKPPWVIEDLLLEQSATLVSAHPHAMKSLSWLQACLEAVTTNQVWKHFDAQNVKSALFIETEDPVWLVETRIRGIAKGLDLDPDRKLPGFRYVCPGPFDLLKEEEGLKGLIATCKPNFAVLSTLQSMLGGRDWNEQNEMQPVMASIIRLSRECPIVLLTHSPWDSKVRRAAGTITQTANFLTTMHYVKGSSPKNGKGSVHIQTDSKAGAVQGDFHLNLQTEGDQRNPSSVRGVYYGGVGWPKGTGKEAVLAAIETDPEAPAEEIARRTRVSARYVRRIREKQAKK
jgi:AAA domain